MGLTGTSEEPNCNIFSHSHAIRYNIDNNLYYYQCGFSILDIITTFLCEIICSVIVIIFIIFVVIWRKNKLLTFIIYCCIIIPMLLQIVLVYYHCKEINSGRIECNSAETKYNANCSIITFIFTPILDILTLFSFLIVAIIGGFLQFLHTKIQIALHANKEEKKPFKQQTPRKTSTPTKTKPNSTETNFETSNNSQQNDSIIDFTKITE
ncbi:Uncharacterized protein QTN25_006839 [Entamoeba marina]